MTTPGDDEPITTEMLEELTQNGDEDAMLITQFEKDFSDMLQEAPEDQLHAM